MRRLLPIILSLTLLPTLVMAQEREWQLDATDQDAFLVFGVPQSDDVGVSFWCKLGSKKIKIMSPVPKGVLKSAKKISLVLNASGKDFALMATAGLGARSSADSVEAETPAAGPLVDALENSDRIGIKVAGHETTFPLLDADLDGLLRLCRELPKEEQP